MKYTIKRFSSFITSQEESFSSETINGKPVHRESSIKSITSRDGHITGRKKKIKII